MNPNPRVEAQSETPYQKEGPGRRRQPDAVVSRGTWLRPCRRYRGDPARIRLYRLLDLVGLDQPRLHQLEVLIGHEIGSEHERERKRSNLLVLTTIVLTLALLVPGREAYASEQALNTRVYAALDNSGSMQRDNRFHRGVQAFERWAESVELRPGLVVELLVAADHVVHQGTFPLRSETDRGTLLDRLRELELERNSTTVFRKIDGELAAFVASTVHPDERFGVVFVTDGRSDAPATDMRLRELGDQLLTLGGGLYAAVSGSVPGQEELFGIRQGQASSPRSEPRRSQSRCRRLFSPSIAIVAPAPLRTEVRERLLGGFGPAQTTIQVENSGEIAREVRLQAEAPKGSTARFVPSSLVIAAGAKVEAAVDIDVTSAVSGSSIVAAQGTDGAVVEATLKVEIATKPWLLSNWKPLVLSTAVAAIILAFLFRVSRRPWFIVPIGRPDRGFEIRPGEEVPLSIADPGFPSGVQIVRRRGGLWLRTSDEPVRLGGASIQPGREVSYRIRTPIDAGSASVVLDRRSRRQAGVHPLVIAGTMENADASNDLL